MSITWRKSGDKWIPDYSDKLFVEDTAAGATATRIRKPRKGQEEPRKPETAEFKTRSSAMTWCERFL